MPNKLRGDPAVNRVVFGESVQGASHKQLGLECQDSFRIKDVSGGALVLAVADGHGSKSCPYSKTGSSIAVNVFCAVLCDLFSAYAGNLPFLLTYLSREGDTGVAKSIDREWKRRVLQAHAKHKRPVPFTPEGEKDKAEIYKQYGTTLVGMAITPLFVFSFQIGDGDIAFVQSEEVKRTIATEKILGTETHSLSKIDAWKKAVSSVMLQPEEVKEPALFLISTDGFSNSFVTEEEYYRSCREYLKMLVQYGPNAIKKNLGGWLEETSHDGCGDDITVLLVYYSPQPME